MKRTQTKRLIEAALMVALATVLSMVKVIDMPYGGSVTLASMLPILVLSYRHGILTGLGGGVAYAAIQQLLGLNSLSYVTGWQSVIAVILLDYIIAFTVVGLGGIFRRLIKNQPHALAVGAVFVSALRFICHFIAGCTVWAGLSIPDSAAALYSLGYNATYMIPETIILVAVAYYVGSLIDFSKDIPTRAAISPEHAEHTMAYSIIGLLSLGAVIADAVMIFPHLQNADTGEFDFSGLASANWLVIGIVTAVALLAAVGLYIYTRLDKKTEAK